MKFIIGKDAPDIPLEILKAQENDELVLFCGAGISYPAGLPLFKGLVEQVYDELNTKPSPQEQQAIDQWRYDTTLELLEKRFYSKDRADKHLVRKAITTRLKLKEDANIETHKSILELAKTKQKKYRLVTTNVDRGFLLADDSSQKMSDVAPKLPVPKPHKWQSIVYLHGLIDEESDPDSENLIFTSGDFGSAYLTERWASRFVSELFRHFTVLFIGYSVDDPVMRYMTDAIAADKRRGYEHFKQPYALAGTKKDQLENAKLNWEAKGISALLYNDENHHAYLHETLQEWAAHCRDGLNGIEQIIKKHGINKPSEPYEHDISVNLVIGYLKLSESAAKVFREIDSPPAPIEWLPILEKEGLLAKFDYNQSPNSHLVQPHKTTIELWYWLAIHHLESKQFVEWVIDKGTNLHPHFKLIIKGILKDKTIQEPYLIFWRILVLESNNSFKNIYLDFPNLETNKDSLDLLALLDLLEPKIKFSKSYSWNDKESRNDKESSKFFDAEVVLEIDSYHFEKVSPFINEMTAMLLPITNALKQTMEFWQLLGKASDKFDIGSWHLSSISPHHQNHGFHNWTLLIELCRDLWQTAYQNDKKLALAIIEIWKTIPFPVFKRLLFHAYANSDIATSSEKLSYLLSDNYYWLWSGVVDREKFRLLASLCPQLSNKDLIKLEKVIIAGVPREMYQADLSDNDFKERNDRKIWLHLVKLESFNVTLSKRAKGIYSNLLTQYPCWALQEEERDEFGVWMSSLKSGYDCDLTIEDFIKLSIEQRIERLSEENSRHLNGRLELLKNICKDKSDIALEMLNFLAEQSNWKPAIWHKALLGLSNTDKPLWTEIAALLIQAPASFFEQEAWVISLWINKSIKTVLADSDDEEYFWLLFDSLIKQAKLPETEDYNRIMDNAINHPMGIITEALISRFSARDIKVGETIINFKLLSRINMLLTTNKQDSFLFAQVILMSRLYYFYIIDPEWAKINLIPLLDWKSSDKANYFWQAFLGNAKISIDLASELKQYLLTALLEHHRELGELSEQLFQLFSVICFEYNDFYSAEEKRNILHKIGIDGLTKISRFIWYSMGDEKEKNDQYWKNRVKPFIENTWPKENSLLDSQISENLASMCIKLNEEFEDAVKTLKPIFKPFKDISLFLRRLRESEHIKNHCVAAFELVGIIFDNNTESYDAELLKEAMSKFMQQDPNLTNNPKYKEIDSFIKQNR
jgi:hypothetical protein